MLQIKANYINIYGCDSVTCSLLTYCNLLKHHTPTQPFLNGRSVTVSCQAWVAQMPRAAVAMKKKLSQWQIDCCICTWRFLDWLQYCYSWRCEALRSTTCQACSDDEVASTSVLPCRMADLGVLVQRKIWGLFQPKMKCEHETTSLSAVRSKCRAE